MLKGSFCYLKGFVISGFRKAYSWQFANGALKFESTYLIFSPLLPAKALGTRSNSLLPFLRRVAFPPACETRPISLYRWMARAADLPMRHLPWQNENRYGDGL